MGFVGETWLRWAASERQDVADFLAALALASVYYSLSAAAEVAGSDAVPRWPAGYLYLLLLLGGTVFAYLRPGIGILACLALLPLTRAPDVPHTFTTAPADYLMVGVAARVALRAVADPNVRQRLILPGVIFLAMSGIALLSFLATLVAPEGLPLKFTVAETAGISLAALYPFAIVGKIRADNMKLALVMLITGCAFTVLFALLGSLQALACLLPVTRDAPFVIRGSRVSGLAADPNQLSMMAAALSAAAAAHLEFTRGSPSPSRMRLPALVLLLMTAGMMILAGSRTGLIIYLLFCLIWIVTSWRQLRLLPIVAGCTALGLSATSLWTHLPCPLRDDPMIVRFAERGDEAAVLARMFGRDIGSPTEQRLTEDFQRSELRMAGAAFDEDLVKSIAGAVQRMATAIRVDLARQLLWRHAALLWGQRPLFGVGPGNMAAHTPYGWRAHNTVLTTAAEMGALGVGALALTAGIVVSVTVRRLRFGTTGWRGWLLLLTGLCALGLGAMAQDALRLGALWAFIGLVLCLPFPERNGVRGRGAAVCNARSSS